MAPDPDKIYPTLWATFRPQRWEGDNAVPDGPGITFRATDKLLALPLSAINKFRENDYDSDYLASDLQERREHDGPFEVDVDIDWWLRDNDCSPRSELSQEELDTLRKRFNVVVDEKPKNTPKRYFRAKH